jgi:hypothetical protein
MWPCPHSTPANPTIANAVDVVIASCLCNTISRQFIHPVIMAKKPSAMTENRAPIRPPEQPSNAARAKVRTPFFPLCSRSKPMNRPIATANPRRVKTGTKVQCEIQFCSTARRDRGSDLKNYVHLIVECPDPCCHPAKDFGKRASRKGDRILQPLARSLPLAEMARSHHRCGQPSSNPKTRDLVGYYTTHMGQGLFWVAT